MLSAMTSPPDTSPPTAPAAPRILRRSGTDRVAAGVAGGLGEYFGVDPVIFRVLFATTAFFGGAGILAYLIAWAAIPERTQASAPIDRVVSAIRRRGLPVWILTIAGVVVVWSLLFSWWTPWRFFPWMFVPLTIAALVLAVALSRREPRPPGAAAPTPPWDDSTAQVVAAREVARSADREAARERRQRSAPVRWATLGTLAITLLVLAIIDVGHGIVIPAYFWAVHIVILAGLVVGAVLRRPVWWLALLLIPAAIGSFVFAGCRASLHDGSGDNTFTPRAASELAPEYRQAFGRTTIDLTQLPAAQAAQDVEIIQASGQVRLIIPESMAVNVHAKVHLGDIVVDGRDDSGGMNISSDLMTPASGTPLAIDVRINAGELRIEHVS
jgi:phage shock protein PspC (stress-responsive transcriptional regulator)